MSQSIDVGAVIRRTFKIYVDQAPVLMPAAAVVFLLSGILTSVLVAAAPGLTLLAVLISLVATTLFTGMIVQLVADVVAGGELQQTVDALVPPGAGGGEFALSLPSSLLGPLLALPGDPLGLGRQRQGERHIHRLHLLLDQRVPTHVQPVPSLAAAAVASGGPGPAAPASQLLDLPQRGLHERLLEVAVARRDVDPQRL